MNCNVYMFYKIIFSNKFDLFWRTTTYTENYKHFVIMCGIILLLSCEICQACLNTPITADGSSQGSLTEMERLSTVDLLVLYSIDKPFFLLNLLCNSLTI